MFYNLLLFNITLFNQTKNKWKTKSFGPAFQTGMKRDWIYHTECINKRLSLPKYCFVQLFSKGALLLYIKNYSSISVF